MQRAKTQKEKDDDRYVKKYVLDDRASVNDDEEAVENDDNDGDEDRENRDEESEEETGDESAKDDDAPRHEDDVRSTSSLAQDDVASLPEQDNTANPPAQDDAASSLSQESASDDNGSYAHSAARSGDTGGVSHLATTGYQPKRRNNNEPQVYKRLGRSMYSAMEIHGFFGLIDTNEVRQGARILTVHIPSRSTSYSFDIKDGDTIYANGLTKKGKGKHAALHVIYSTLHQYYAPGRKVTSCTIGVPNEEWTRFMHESQ